MAPAAPGRWLAPLPSSLSGPHPMPTWRRLPRGCLRRPRRRARLRCKVGWWHNATGSDCSYKPLTPGIGDLGLWIKPWLSGMIHSKVGQQNSKFMMGFMKHIYIIYIMRVGYKWQENGNHFIPFQKENDDMWVWFYQIIRQTHPCDMSCINRRVTNKKQQGRNGNNTG